MNKGQIVVLLGIFLVVTVVFSFVPNSFAYNIEYETNDFKLYGTPTVCGMEPREELTSKEIEKLMEETKWAVNEWETRLKLKDSRNKDVWEINYIPVTADQQLRNEEPDCDIKIIFEPKPSHPEDYFIVLGLAETDPDTGTAIITIYYQGISQNYVSEREGDIIYYWYEPYYTDDLRLTAQIGAIVRHEFGHTLGLGHYYADDIDVNVTWSKGNSPAPSIMVVILYENTKEMKITPTDIEKLISIYGEEGFTAIKPVVEDVLIESEVMEKPLIPDWIRNNARWWADGQIGDSDFTSGIQYMIKENIMVIPDLPESTEGGEEQVPDWVRNNAGWWADGLISDDDFVSGIRYLVEQGIIRV